MLLLAQKDENARFDVSKEAIFLALVIATAQELMGKKFEKLQFKELLRVVTLLLERLNTVIQKNEISKVLREIDKSEGMAFLNANVSVQNSPFYPSL